MAQVCAAHRDRLSFLAIVVPDSRDAATDATSAFDLRAAGIGELNADAQGFDFADPATMADLVDVCRTAGRPIMFHASEPVGQVYPGKGTRRRIACCAGSANTPINRSSSLIGEVDCHSMN